MIEVRDIQATTKELRTLTRGWGGLHWVAVLPQIAFPVGFLTFGLLALGGDEPRFPLILLFGSFLIASLVWIAACQILMAVTVRAMRASPMGAQATTWRLDADWLEFGTDLQQTRIDWRGVKAFVEEKDRFLFLITPALNLVLPKRLLSPEQSTELRALIAEVTVSGRMGTGVDSPPPSSDNPRS